MSDKDRAYYATNRERKLAYARAYAEKNREQIALRNKAYYEAHKSKLIERAKKNYKVWAKANPGRVSELKRKYTNVRRYGLTGDEFDRMFLEQDGKCAICEQPPRKRQLAIDHDHSSGRVRQLLCTNCNAMLGHSHESQKILTRAIEYLRSHASRSAA